MNKVATFHVIPGLTLYTELPGKSRDFFIENKVKDYRATVFSPFIGMTRIHSMVSVIFEKIRNLRNSDSTLHAAVQRRESVVSCARTLMVGAGI